MRFPYLGTARVKYLLSMIEHRRQMDRSPKWPAVTDFADTRAVATSSDWAIGTRPDKDSRLTQPMH